jgi:hypothetical protein
MGRRRVRTYLGVAALVLASCLACGFLLRPADRMEATWRRVQLDMDEEAVIAAVGRPPDSSWGAGEGRPGPVLVWVDRDLRWLCVQFDANGRVVKAEAGNKDGRTGWDRLVEWWPW